MTSVMIKTTKNKSIRSQLTSKPSYGSFWKCRNKYQFEHEWKVPKHTETVYVQTHTHTHMNKLTE